MEKSGLSTATIQSLKSIFSKYKVIDKVILYGSRAIGKYKPGSDIDLTLIAPDMSLTEFFKLETDLDDLMLPYKIDLSLHHRIENANLLRHIEEFGLEF